MGWGLVRYFLLLAAVLAFTASEVFAKGICEGLLRSAQLETAAKKGVTIAIRSPFTDASGKDRKPTSAEMRDLEEMYGAQVIIDDINKPIPANPRKIPGLLIHMLDVGEGLKSYRGHFNLFQQGPLFKRVVDQKWEEYAAVSPSNPNVMPQTRQATDLIKVSTHRDSFYKSRRNLAAALDRFVNSLGTQVSTSTKNNVIAIIGEFFATVEEIFPNGSFIKYIGERATGDRGQLIRLPNSTPEKLADIFVTEVERAKGKTNRNVKSFSSPAFLKALNDTEMSAVSLVQSLLLDSDKIIAQEAVNIARTRDGTLAEVRVDFTSVGPIAATLRWGYDVAIDYKRKALEFFDDFWSSAPDGIRELSGAADVAILEDGSMVIIEFNFGNDSGFVDPIEQLIPANVYLTNILGKPTPLIQQLDSLALSDQKTQIAYLSGTIPKIKTDDEHHYSIREMYLPDAFQYIRDRMIERWLEKPTAQNAQVLSSRFQEWADSQSGRLTPEMRTVVQDLALFGKQYMEQMLAAPSEKH